MKMGVLKYLSVFVIYFIVDVTYQMVFGIPFSKKIQEEAGIAEIFASEIQNPVLMLVWFAIMTLAIVKLVVEPAVEAKSLKMAATRGLLLGVTAYGTLALPNGWSLAGYPLSLVLEVLKNLLDLKMHKFRYYLMNTRSFNFTHLSFINFSLLTSLLTMAQLPLANKS